MSPPRGRDPARERLAAAMVDLVGGRGLATLDVATLCERAGVHPRHFHRCFANLEDCFLVLHDELVGELCDRVRSAYDDGPPAWHDRVWAAGWAAMRFLREDPARARFLLVAVNGVGAGAQERRDGILRGLADLLDRGREGVERSGPMSRATAEITAGAVHGTLLAKVEAGAIERGEEFLSELVYVAVMPYLGSSVAEDELAVQPLR